MPSPATRSLPGLSSATLPATSSISLVRAAEAGGGAGCRHVDTDSKACTPRLYEHQQPMAPGVAWPRAGGAGGPVPTGAYPMDARFDGAIGPSNRASMGPRGEGGG